MLLNLFCIVFGRSLFGRCIVWPSLIYDFWLPIWYLQTFDHCIICPSIYGLWLPLWYLQTFVHCIVYPSIHGSWLPFGIYRLLSIALSILQSTVPYYPLVSTDFYYCQMDSGNSSKISTLHINAPHRFIKDTVSVFNQIIIQCCEYLFRNGVIRF